MLKKITNPQSIGLLQTRWLRNCVLLLLLATLTSSSLHAQEPTARERRDVRKIKTNLERAGKYYKAEKFELSKKQVETAMAAIEKLSLGARAELIEIIEPEFKRLQNAHRLLTESGQSLAELKPLPKTVENAGDVVSFRTDVAPILVAKCGNCHVDRDRGNFSTATFEALDKSTTIAYGLPQDSRLIEIIESGEMPKGGLKVTADELQTLKLWIKQGAKFDGDDTGQNLKQLTAAPPAEQPKPVEPSAPTGNETVSFGLHIAPILIEHCGQCHITNRRPRGGLNMGSFERLLAGGDSGAVIIPGKPDKSPLLTRIVAGEMPPRGKLDSSLVDLIRTWIAEGATFDGNDIKLEIRDVAAKAVANSQTHAELAAARKELAVRTWKLVMDKTEPRSVASDNFYVGRFRLRSASG